MVKTLTPKEVAQALDTDAKTVRKFLRSRSSGIADQAPGKGGRWAIEAKKVRSLKSRFSKWDEARRDADGKVTTDDPEVEVEDAPEANDA